MEETLTRRVPRCRLFAFTFTLAVLLSISAPPPVHAQEDCQGPICDWPGTLEVSTRTLKIPEGGAATYDLRLTQQPEVPNIDDDPHNRGWWVRLHVDGAVRIDGLYDDDEDGKDTIQWIPSVGWEFKPQGGSGPTQWRGITIRALEDDDTEDEVITFRHEVWDEDSECPDFLHPDSLPVVTVRIIDNDRPGTQPRLSIADTSVVEGNPAQFNVNLTSESTQPVTVTYETADGTAKEGTDYEARTGTLTFPAGATLQTILVPTVGDAFHEPEERFRVTPEQSVGGHAGRRHRGGDDLGRRPAGAVHRQRVAGDGGRYGPVRCDVDTAQRADGHGGLRDDGRDGDGGLGLPGAVGDADVHGGADDDDDLGADHRR